MRASTGCSGVGSPPGSWSCSQCSSWRGAVRPGTSGSEPLTVGQKRRRGRERLIARKVLGSLLTLVFVLVFNFLLFRVVQTDPIGSLFRGRNVPQATLDNLRESFGLDQSLGTQFVFYLRETAQLNFGLSYQSRQPV